MAIPTRGLRNLRTHSGRVDRVAVAYQAYMQITCLEMEKARRGAERRSAAQRMRDIDTRLQEIEAEKSELLRVVREDDNGGLAKRPGMRAVSSPRPSAEGFKIRY